MPASSFMMSSGRLRSKSSCCCFSRKLIFTALSGLLSLLQTSSLFVQLHHLSCHVLAIFDHFQVVFNSIIILSSIVFHHDQLLTKVMHPDSFHHLVTWSMQMRSQGCTRRVSSRKILLTSCDGRSRELFILEEVLRCWMTWCDAWQYLNVPHPHLVFSVNFYLTPMASSFPPVFSCFLPLSSGASIM